MIGSAAVGILLSFLFRGPSLSVTIVNTIFMMSLFLLMTGGSMLILEGGMFNGIMKSFKSFRNKSSKANRYAAEFDDYDNDEENPAYSFRLTMPFLISGTVLFVLTIIVSYFV
ncbi:DUF3899 domain-containing protein [Bacillus marinisedimentorum]|uniref:DUF3899 domain-containing protein n=1 Tax=Bacillus marinisedimentorum TaxID=1821260 RepID=UPI001471E445|nr:DUF3899 domain-containing protein [Bacillus marinisedimentorum]